MLQQFLSQKITENLPFIPTQEQKELIGMLAEFITSDATRKTFLLKGYAGTGKTSVVGALVKALQMFEQKCVLLAPTGWAAKVFTLYSEKAAYSIHKQIYRQKSASEFLFQLDRNLHSDTLFIVDEASMISNSLGEGRLFGSGNLLDDLVEYVFSNERNGLLLLGDDAQLPPFMQADSPAMNPDFLKSYGLDLSDFQLKNVVRQAVESGILWNSTILRNRIMSEKMLALPLLSTNFQDINKIGSVDLIDVLSRTYDRSGVENTMIITRSNKRANRYNQGIRGQILMKEEELSKGDLLLITKNNYFWSKGNNHLDFIANGDIARVGRIRKYQELYGCRFADVSLCFEDYEVELEVKILLDSFSTETASDVELLNRKLHDAVMEDYAHIGNKRERYKELRNNEFYNSLQVKFAYAVTCHKAQGGQWENVFVDYVFLGENNIGNDYYRWLYTAFTRARKQLCLVNFPDSFFEP